MTPVVSTPPLETLLSSITRAVSATPRSALSRWEPTLQAGSTPALVTARSLTIRWAAVTLRLAQALSPQTQPLTITQQPDFRRYLLMGLEREIRQPGHVLSHIILTAPQTLRLVLKRSLVIRQ